MSFKEDHERWQEAVVKIINIRQLTEEMILMDFNVVLDQLNSLDYSTKIVTRNEEAWQVLSKCCALVPSDGSNNQLVSKFCQLIINILAKHKIPVGQAVLDDLLKFLMLSVQKCQQWVLLENLQALMAVLNENGAMCEEFAETLIGRSPDGLLVSLCQDSSNDPDTRSCAICCVGHLCTRTENGESLPEQFVSNGLEILLEILQTPADPREQELQHFRLINTSMRALINVLGACSVNQKSHLGPLLTALKSYMFCGMPGYELKLSDEKKRFEDNSDTRVSVNELTSVNVEPVHHKNRSYMFKKKRRRGGAKKETKPQKPQVPFRPGTKYMSHSSMDALTPAFARTTISVGGVEHGANSPTTKEALQARVPPVHTSGHPIDDNGSYSAGSNSMESVSQKTPVEQLSDDGSSNLSGSEGFSATSSDSDLSDSEAGQAARMWSLLSRVRQNALTCLQLVIKGSDRKELFGYWSLFIPDNSAGSSWSLFTTILKDPAAKVRACAVGVLMELLEGSRPFLAAADDREEHNISTVRPFTSFSAKLGAVVHGLHRCLLQALSAETSTFLRVQIVKCISALMVNSPYNRLKEGLITKIAAQVKPLLTHKDPALRVSVLTCFGMSVSVHSPLHEVVDLMKPTTYPSGKPCVTSEVLNETATPRAPSVNNKLQEPAACPWLVSHCGHVVSRTGEPIAVRVQGLQVLAAFLRNYFDIVSPSIPWLTDLAVSCLKDSDTSLCLHGIKLLEELAKTMYACITEEPHSKGIKVSSEQLLDFWLMLLQGPLTTVLQDSSSKFCSAAVDCLSNIGSHIFEILPMDKRILCITLCLGLSNDEDKYLKSSAVRALGVLVLYPVLRPDVLFVADSANSILSCMQDTTLGVRIKAAWALGNLSDALVHNKLSEVSTFTEDFSDMLLLKLLDCAITACDDRDKVKSNGVRAVGNFLRYVGPSSLKKRGFTASVEKAAQALARNAGTGLMKVRWNACYAIGNVFRNLALPVGTAEWTGVLFAALENVIKECKNFKVRINAVLAVSIPPERRFYGNVKQYCSTWETVTTALLGIETLADFADFKYRDTLREQLCYALCHMLNFITQEDVVQLSSALELHGQVLKEHVTRYISQVSSQTEDVQSEDSEQSSNEKLQVLLTAKNHIRDLDQSEPAVQRLTVVLSGNVEETRDIR